MLTKRITFWFFALLACIFFLQGYLGGSSKSLTWDEPIFIASGYSYLTRNDFRLNPEAPPLMQLLEALPLLGMGLRQPGPNHPAWTQGNHFWFARQFLTENVDLIQDIAHRARLPVLLIGALLILSIGSWGNRLYGHVPALVGVWIAAFSPNLIAHSKLATTDLGCTAFVFFAVYALWRAFRTEGWLDWIICGAVTALALLTKFTALLLGPIYLGIFAIRLVTHPAQRVRSIKGLLITGGVALLGVSAGYNLSFDPAYYVEGIRQLYASATPGYKFYLFGQVSEDPWWYYHIAAFLVKVPLPIILLLGLSTVLVFRDPDHREAALYLLFPAFIIIGASFFDEANIGLRRILPAFPFLFLFCSLTLAGVRHRLMTGFICVMLAWTSIAALGIYPHHLAYFNLAAGGPEHGPHLLEDSNIDWGQDLPALAEWQMAHPEASPLKLLYFGNVPPEAFPAYGVRSIPISRADTRQPSNGYYAVSVHHLIGFRKAPELADWLSKYHPISRAGYSIYIYRFE